MKAIINLIIVVLIIGAGYYFMENYMPHIDLPFGKDDSYKLDITSAKLPANITVTNNSDINLRLHVFYANDMVKAVAKYNDILKKGKSINYPRDNYVFNIWKSQFLDAHIKWTGTLGSDVIITGTQNNLKIKGKASPPTNITNTVNEQLKVCTYNAGDLTQAIPLVCWNIGKDRSINWKSAPKKFIVKVFSPALLDIPLVTESAVSQSSHLVIRKE